MRANVMFTFLGLTVWLILLSYSCALFWKPYNFCFLRYSYIKHTFVFSYVVEYLNWFHSLLTINSSSKPWCTSTSATWSIFSKYLEACTCNTASHHSIFTLVRIKVLQLSARCVCLLHTSVQPLKGP